MYCNAVFDENNVMHCKEVDEHIDQEEKADEEPQVNDVEETENEMQQTYIIPSNESSDVKLNELINVEDE